jgi:single-stranded DNA-binding protein
MAKSINKVILVGNVGADPEVKYTPSGIPVGKFTLATNERFKNKSGEWQDRTEWHNIVAWQRLAEIVGEYVSKGSKVYIEGKLQTSSWEDQQSGERSTGPRSWLATSCCWACERTETRSRNKAPAANSVSLTMPGLAKSRTRISRSETDLPEASSL